MVYFSFVRFYDSESALKATRELGGWKLKGSSILVDISKDTAEKMKLGNHHFYPDYAELKIFFKIGGPG